MSKRKKQTPTPQEVFDNTNACITCLHEDLCTKLNKIFDPNNFDVTSTFTVYTIKVTTLSGDKVDYYVYVNNKSTVSNFNMKFQW